MNHLIRLQRFMRPYLAQISANLFVLLAVTGLGLIVPLILKKVIDDGLLRDEPLRGRKNMLEIFTLTMSH
jgi:ABC-type multidrug transport system fused ATPase/permease subunit